MRKITKTILLIATLMVNQGAWAQGEPWEGSGTETNPYKIRTEGDLVKLSENVNNGNSYLGKYFELQNDLNFSEGEYDFAPIGIGNEEYEGIPFQGIFNGKGYTIGGIDYAFNPDEEDGVGIGLFGYIWYPAIIKNVKLDNSSFTGNYQVGGIVGASGGYGSDDYGIFNCTVGSDVTIKAEEMTIEEEEIPGSYAGGIIGYCHALTVKDCYSEATVVGDEYVGGIAGYILGNTSSEAFIEESYYNSSAEKAVGGRGPMLVDDEWIPADATKGILKITLFDDDTDETIKIKNKQRMQNYSGLNCDVTIKGRTLYKDGHWNTINLPFQILKQYYSEDVECPLYGATIKKFNINSSELQDCTLTLTFDDVTSHTANNTPYLVKWESGNNITDPEFKNVYVVYRNTIVSHEDYDVDFIGITTPKSFVAGDRHILFMGADDKLYYPAESLTINAFRGYFKLQNNILASGLPSDSENGVNVVLNFDGESTGIQTINNGQWSMVNGQWYTIDGRKLNGRPTQKGLYIHGGKKVMLK